MKSFTVILTALATIASAQTNNFSGTVSLGSSGKCLRATSNSDNAAVVAGDCSGAADTQWSFNYGTVRIFGNKCLDVTNGNDVNGQQLQIYTCYNGNTNQQWYYNNNHIGWRGHTRCLDVTNGRFQNGNPIQIWDCIPYNSNQNFIWNTVSPSNPGNPGGPGCPAQGAITPAATTVTITAGPGPTVTSTVTQQVTTITVTSAPVTVTVRL
ncbi:hypothetical protein D9758_012872 [Tetrapyrgos nigripes]|uniref:Ricin B lectin domain-containing protein n=1 Tax=Tetrapyrgos nigripes TaxID=182062 RepID=A0A8H5ET34_9AGAR|nr:hypothetical protein D9758_018565 [Tetrapyrgos nigripes]KAF5338250.1 hypothetical protein D9758_012872 [Tetrapyrgos nigripes]